MDVWVIESWVDSEGGVSLGVASTQEMAVSMAQRYAKKHGRAVDWKDVGDGVSVGYLSDEPDEWDGDYIYDDYVVIRPFTMDSPLQKPGAT